MLEFGPNCFAQPLHLIALGFELLPCFPSFQPSSVTPRSLFHLALKCAKHTMMGIECHGEPLEDKVRNSSRLYCSINIYVLNQSGQGKIRAPQEQEKIPRHAEADWAVLIAGPHKSWAIRTVYLTNWKEGLTPVAASHVVFNWNFPMATIITTSLQRCNICQSDWPAGSQCHWQ